VMCIDYLTAILALTAPREFPRSCLYEEGELRMIAIAPTFESLLVEAFDQIRGSAAGNAGIIARMLSALETLSDLTVSPRRRRAIRDQVRWLAEVAGRNIESKHDRDRLARRLTDVREALKAEPALRVEEEKE